MRSPDMPMHIHMKNLRMVFIWEMVFFLEGIFTRSLKSLTNDLHLLRECYPELPHNSFLDKPDKFLNVAGCSSAVVDDEVGVDLGHPGPTDFVPLKTCLLDEHTGRHLFRVSKD